MDVVILICALGIAQPDCSVSTAEAVIRGPEATGPAMCGLHGQAYIASTSLAGYLADGHYLKLNCTPRGLGAGPRPRGSVHAER